MGIKLMVEVFDHWQDGGLTLGERSDLLVLAENANDGTRQTFGPVHAEYILRRAGKTAASWRVAINKLMKKKVLEYATKEGRELRGHTGQSAVYRLVPLCSSPPHSGYRGHCTKPILTGGGEGHPSGDPSGLGYPADNAVKGEAPEEGYPAATPGEPSDNPVDGVGYPAATEWVSSQITPTPPYPSFKTPSTTSSTSPAMPSTGVPQPDPEVTDGGGGGSDLRSLAVHIATSLDYQGKPPTQKQRQTIEDRLVVFLEADWTMDDLAIHLDLTGQVIRYAPAVYIDRLNPVELSGRRPSLSASPSPFRGGALGPVATAEEINALTLDSLFDSARSDSADGGLFGRAMARAQRRMAVGAAAREHQPFRNYDDDSIYDAPFWPEERAASKPPWCGDLDCDEKTRLRDGEDENGLPHVYRCEKCHPGRARAA